MSILVYWYISILVYWYIGMLVHWYVKIQILWYVDDVLFGFDLNVISSIRRSINIGISTSIEVSTCIIVIAGVSSGNTNIHMGTDIFY